MILETLDVKQNDIFIYSTNKFDLEENFKLINKDADIKHPVSIHFNDVCSFIYDDKPKSIVVYRLLTNFPSFNSSLVKYGIIVNIDSEPEVIYFDPIFALRELDEYGELEHFPNLKFRIQQVGLISSYRVQGEANFQEVYSFDLEATEVKWQNDRVYAELIFAFEDIDFDGVKSYKDTKSESKTGAGQRFKTLTAEDLRGGVYEEEAVEEKEDFNRRSVVMKENKPSAPRMERVLTVQSEPKNLKPSFSVVPPPPKLIPENPKKTDENSGRNEKATFGDFLSKVKNEPSSSGQQEPSEKKRVIDLFKSTNGMQDFVVERGKKQVVLKFKKRT